MLNPHEVSERIRILEEAFVSQAERIRELTRQNQDLRLALSAIATGDGYYGAQALEYKQIARRVLAAIAEQNAGADSGSGGRAAGEPAGGGSDAGVASPPAAPDHSADVGKMVVQARREAPVLTNLTDPTMPKEPSIDAKLALGRVFVTVFGGGDDRQMESGRGRVIYDDTARLYAELRAALAKEQGR